MIDEHPSHDLRGRAKEVRSIPRSDLALVNEAQIHFVNEGRRLQDVIASLPPKLARSNGAAPYR